VDIADFSEVKHGTKLLIKADEQSDIVNINHDIAQVEQLSIPDPETLDKPTNYRMQPWLPNTFHFKAEDLDVTCRHEIQAAQTFYEASICSEEGKIVRHAATIQLRKAVVCQMFNFLIKFGVYPTLEKYKNTCQCMIDAVPCLKDTSGSGIDTWICSLRDRFSDYRRRNKDTREVIVNSGTISLYI
jgi:hypothetical protein